MFIARIENDIAVEYPISEKQFRNRFKDVSLPKRLTSEILKSLGYVFVENADLDKFPQATKDFRVVLDSVVKQGDRWVRTYKLEPVVLPIEKNARIRRQWELVRKQRDELIKQIEWKVSRYNREIALGITPTDDIVELHKYIQELTDITKQPDPFLVKFPTPPGE